MQFSKELTSKFATDSSKEEDGVWIPVTDQIKFKIRRLKSRASQDARAELIKPYAALVRHGELPDQTAVELLEKQIAKAVIVEWEGVTTDAGESLPCTYENRLALLKTLPELRDFIVQVALERDAFKTTSDEDAEKN